ncbi:hypothetical protein CAC42_6735 [Sphaceloma murrayae]|uniref:Uncharacterized protein n=1 Tax=Sphaceloma murrayae TaxID=2082308 RepID=A0A2K1QH48_9PEZI|nr:hypothetical protein CAC42_6735 [Sphaceloma murrayae]
MKTRAQERGPSAEPGASQQESRLSRKRRASVASQASDALEHSQSESQQVVKKRKKSKVTVKQTSQSQENSNGHPTLPIVQEESTQITVNDGRSPDMASTQEDVHLSQTSTQKTSSRRVTMPPSAFSDEGHQLQPQQKNRPRKSLPAALDSQTFALNGYDSGMESLNKLVAQRVKQRMEAQALSQLDGSDDVDMTHLSQDMLVYTHIDDPDLDVKSQDGDRADSLADVDPSMLIKTDQERAQYEASINRLYREASEAKSALEILTVELQAMGFGGPDADSQGVIESVRSSFNQVRYRLRDILPLQTSEDVLEHALLKQITDYLIRLHGRDAQREVLLAKKDTNERALLIQVDELIEKLADAEIIRQRLQTANEEFEQQNLDDEKYIKELENKMAEVTASLDHVSGLLGLKTAQIKDLEVENNRLEESCEKIKSAVETYRQAETTLENLVNRLEKEHARSIEQSQQDHDAEKDRLMEALHDERQAREAEEARTKVFEQKIADLSKSAENKAAAISKLKAQIEELKAETLALQTEKDATEDDGARKTEHITALQQQLTETEASLNKIEEDLADLRKLNEAEKRQREAAETELDESHVKVKSLNDKLHKQGLEANELRSKLFQAQQREQQASRDFETARAEQTEQFEVDFAAEATRREEAEALAEQRQSDIGELERKLINLESSMKKALYGKEFLLQDMESRCVTLDGELEETRRTLADKTAEHHALQESTTTIIVGLEQDIQSLRADLAAKTDDLENIRSQSATQQQQMLTTLSARDATIITLTNDLTNAEHTIAALESDKSSLERRVTSEAEAMLSYTAEKEEQIDNLNNVICDKQAEIESLSEKATEVDRAWNAFAKGKDLRIEELERTEVEREESFTLLNRGYEKVKEQFKEYVRVAEERMARLARETERLDGIAKGEEMGLKKEGKRMLEEIEEEHFVDAVLGNGAMESPVERVVEKKKVKRSKKMVRDSGIGGSDDADAQIVAI